jgi:glucosamine kinase
MAYFLGIDGGGTKTRCVLADETTVLARSMTGASNIVRLGEQQAREALHGVIRQVCAATDISLEQISAVCIGAAGAARPEIAARVRNIITELSFGFTSENVEVVGDAEVALEAAFGEGPGVIVIAGTGSIAYGRDAAGRAARAGGWGFAVSDEGSGHWIGRRAVTEILNSADRGFQTQLRPLVLQTWKIESIDQLVQMANSTPPPDFPRLFPLVLRAADDGDAIAGMILTDAGGELAELATIVIGRLAGLTREGAQRPGAGLPVALTGSVFRQSSEVRQVFWHALQTNFPSIEVRQELVDPVEGSLARARRIRK